MSLAVSAPGALQRTRAVYGSILVVIPCLNEAANIAYLAAQVLRASPRFDMLVVVADGGSTDATREIVAAMARAEPRLKLIDNPRRLQSAGVNVAVRRFGEGRRWLVRMDAHAEYPDDYIPHLVEDARETGASSVVVAMVSRGEGQFQEAAALVQNSLLGTGGSAHRRAGKAGFVDHGHHALFDMEQFIDLGGYDDKLSHNEDAEFDIRLARAGGRIWLTRATDIVYFPRANPGALFQQYRNYGRGRATTILRHHVRPKLRQLLPACVAPALVAALATPWFPWAGVPALLWACACILGGAALGLSRRPACALCAALAAILIHLGWSAGFWSELVRTSRRRAWMQIMPMRVPQRR